YAYLKEYVLPYLVNTSSPRFIGHMTSALPSFNYELTDLVLRLNQNLVKVETSKSLVFLERQAMAMLHHAFYDFPESFYTEYAQQSGNSLGITVSGGSLANISALWVARNLLLPPDDIFPGVAQAGLNAALAHYKYKNIVLLGSRLMHYSMKKAVSLLGLGMENIVYVDQDENGKMDIAALERCIEECRQKQWCILALVGIAGATETGNIDPLEEMAEIAKTFNIHFHVDGAWGGPVVFSNRHKHKLKGIEKADSITLCGHKQLYLPQGISFCLFRQPDMVKAISISAAYQAREGGYDFGQYSPEGSRSSLSMCLHAALHLIGKQGYAKLIDNGIDKAQYLTEQLHKTEAFELMREPELNIVNFRYIPIRFRGKQAQGLLTTEDNLQINEANVQLQEMQFQEGRSFFSRTQLSNTRYGKDLPIEVNRAVLANPLTTYQDIDFVLEDQLTIAAKSIENEYPSTKQEISKLAFSLPKPAEQEALLD
ncbi:glutamate decarboxylase eukaryotic type, partial [Candidatus Thiomargarita nelsonii]